MAADGLKKCNLVMKGGITSGVVYPSAVGQLKDKYRFHQIGGTSAGAIAAALTAAAEFARDSGGFERLRGVQTQLAAPGFIRSVFQPSPQTKVLMDFASKALAGAPSDPKWLRLVKKIGGSFLVLLIEMFEWLLISGLVVAGIGAAIVWYLHGYSHKAPAAIFIFVSFILGMCIGGGWGLLHKLLVDVRLNFFGICTGRTMRKRQQGLTDWLTEQIDLIACKAAGGHLTFGDLRNRSTGDEIVLQMMTTNLSQEFPYTLPFVVHAFIFEEAEMRKVFPDSVVQQMVDSSRSRDRDCRVKLSSGNGKSAANYHFLPIGDDLPVVVATRMSLSFPVLLSAVPLYTLNSSAFPIRPQTTYGQDDLDLNWFSDGGLSSNFPIHFFDPWLPTEPTFGITLTSMPPNRFDEKGELKADVITGATEFESEHIDPTVPSVYLPKINRTPPRICNPVSDMFGFFGSIVSTMQNYRDNMQSEMPSYRERIVQIRLAKDEGGLNLDMSQPTIETIMKKGVDGGQLILTEFNELQHEWARLQVWLGAHEPQIEEMRNAIAAYEQILDDMIQSGRQSGPEGFPYEMPLTWCREANAFLADLKLTLDKWPSPKHGGYPKPPGELRISPRR